MYKPSLGFLFLLFFTLFCFQGHVTCKKVTGGAITETHLIGPIKISANGEAMSRIQASIPRSNSTTVVVAFQAQIIDAKNNNTYGQAQVFLHHVVLLNQAAHSANCPELPEILLASGGELTPIKFPPPYGLIVEPTDSWRAIYHIVNYLQKNITAYITYNLTYYEVTQNVDNQTYTGINGNGTFSALTPLWFDVTGCDGDAEFDVPGNGTGRRPIYAKSNQWSVGFDSSVVYAVGHLHAGGIDITMTVGDDKQSICTSKPTYTPNKRFITRMSSCSPKVFVPANTTFEVTGDYNNSVPLEGVMAIMMTFVDKNGKVTPPHSKGWVRFLVIPLAAVTLVGVATLVIFMVRRRYLNKRVLSYSQVDTSSYSHTEEGL